MIADIEINNLNKIYKLGTLEIEVLRDVNLIINAGEFLSIMGPSGSGKSTLLYIIGGLDSPTSGNVRIKGRELSSLKDADTSLMRRKMIGFVFQFYNLIPNLNVTENILLPVLLDGGKMRMYKRKLNDLLEIVELTDKRHHTPRELSGGQQQRVAIARALINEPDIILADEPIGNLDSKSGIQIMNLLQSINKERGKTIIQVTHSQIAAEYGSRLINVKDGRVEE